jgi:hypothetical protein
MVRLVGPSEFASTTGNDSYPPEYVMRTAHRIADILHPGEACEVVRELFYEECADVLGAGDREELLDELFAERARLRRELLVAAGLSADPDAASRNDLPPHSDRRRANHADRN